MLSVLVIASLFVVSSYAPVVDAVIETVWFPAALFFLKVRVDPLAILF